MNALIIVAAILGVLVIIAFLLRVSAVFLFLSVAIGSLLATYLSDDTGLALSMAVRDAPTTLIAKFVLLLAPIGLTILFMRKTMPRPKMLLHLLPIIATALSAIVLVLPLLDKSVQDQIFNQQYGNLLKNSQDVVLGSTAVLVLFLMWLTERHKEGKGRHK